MRSLLIAASCLSLSACLEVPEPMSREQVIAAVKECEAAGMKAVLYSNWHNRIADVQCHIKPEPPHDPH